MPFGYHNNTMQNPLGPAQSVNCIQTPAGFESQLWASEEDAGNIKAVVAFAFDARGRMWAAETFDYPNVIKAPFEGRDRILILEDTDKDGSVDKSTVFSEGYNIPQGLEWTPDGLVVAMPPYLLLLEDKNGDDKADDPKGRILYQGFNKTNPGDTHGGISNLHWSLDGWTYGMVGYNGGTVSGTKFGQGFFRFRSDGSKFEFLGATSNNSWGIGIGEDGQVFGSTANCNESDHMVMAGHPAQKLRVNDKMHALTADWMQHSCVGQFTAAAGHEIYTSRLFPKEYWNRAALVCEPTGHLVAQFTQDPWGSTWKSGLDTSWYNLWATTDAWSAPIAAKVGPDGAVWILDWYTYIVQHNGDPVGAGGAFVTDLRDKKYCRIHRVVPTGKPLEAWTDLSKATAAQLVAAFSHPNLLWRLQAQRTLLARSKADAAIAAQLDPLLGPLLDRRAKDEVGNDAPLVHALWTLQLSGRFQSDAAKWNPVLAKLLLHPAPAARANVLRAMPRTAASSQAIKDQGRVNDPDAHVRLQALLALAAIPDKVAGISLYAGYRNSDAGNGDQPKWADLAFTASGVAEAAALPAIPPLEVVVAAQPAADPRPVPAAFRLRLRADGSVGLPYQPSTGPGILTLSDLRGRVLGRAGYDGSAWDASGLGRVGEGVVLFDFAGADGVRFAGRAARTVSGP